MGPRSRGADAEGFRKADAARLLKEIKLAQPLPQHHCARQPIKHRTFLVDDAIIGTQYFYCLPGDRHKDKMSFLLRNTINCRAVLGQLISLQTHKSVRHSRLPQLNKTIHQMKGLNISILFLCHSCVRHSAGSQLIHKDCRPKLQKSDKRVCAPSVHF